MLIQNQRAIIVLISWSLSNKLVLSRSLVGSRLPHMPLRDSPSTAEQGSRHMHRRNKPAGSAFKRSVGSAADFPSLTWATSRSDEFSRFYICDVDCQTSRRRLVTLGAVQKTLLLEQQPDSQPHSDCHPHRLHRAGYAPLRPHVRGGWKGGLPLHLPPAGIFHSPSSICYAPGSGSKLQWSTRTTSCTSGLWLHCPCRQ